MARALFTLCRVYHGERWYWYGLFRDPVTGKRTNKKSVEVLRTKLGYSSTSPITRKSEAESICAQALEKGIVFAPKDATQSVTTCKEYLSHFFDWDTSEYIQRKISLDPMSLSRDYMATRNNLIHNHILPLLDDTPLGEVSLHMLEDLQVSLVKQGKLSRSTLNMAMGAVLTALKESQRRGDIPLTPVLSLPSLKVEHRIRGVLTEKEVSEYLAFAKKQSNPRIYLSAITSLFTGMRSGELRALTVDQVQKGMIVVDRAFANQQGIKTPKGKKTRIVPCPQFICDELLAFAHTNPYRCKETLVFWSGKNGEHVSSHYFCAIFHATLIASGVLTKEAIENRYITFHSFRHMANTLLRGSVDEYVLRLTIGHSSEQLSNLYTHLSEKAFKSVQEAQNANILPLLQG